MTQRSGDEEKWNSEIRKSFLKYGNENTRAIMVGR